MYMRDSKVKLSLKIERFAMNIPDKDIAFVEKLAREYGCTMSWIYRAILFALAKKFKKGFPGDLDIHRPDKFVFPFRQTTVCFYGDKVRWMVLSRIWHVELGPLIRFGLDLYYKGELDLDLDDLKTVKEVKIVEKGKFTKRKNLRGKRRCIYQYQNIVQVYQKSAFRPKNPDRNISLMERGLSNRNYPIIA